MSRQNKRNTQRGKHSKKRKGVDRKKLAIVIIGLFIVLFLSFKIVQGIASKISVAKDNVNTLESSVSGESEDTSNVDTHKQFDLEEENGTQDKKYVVYIDAGHGGVDAGYKTKSGKTEKDIDLEISKLISSRLSSQGDINVIISRNTDRMLSNAERVEDGNRQNADVFVSIHMAGNDDKSAEGIQTFYRVGADDASNELATLVQKSVISYVDLKDRGATPFTFDVLQGNNMPAILIQCGFLTNNKDAKNLANPDFQKNLAEGISQGILSFLDTQG